MWHYVSSMRLLYAMQAMHVLSSISMCGKSCAFRRAEQLSYSIDIPILRPRESLSTSHRRFEGNIRVVCGSLAVAACCSVGDDYGAGVSRTLPGMN